jgi:hypothetical protein
MPKQDIKKQVLLQRGGNCRIFLWPPFPYS